MYGDRIEVRQLNSSSDLPLLREFREGHSRYKCRQLVSRQNSSEKTFLRDGTSARFELCRSLVDASWCEEDNTSLLASGSADGFVKVWDTRTAEERPVASLSSMTAVSQVQWRRQCNRYVASTHGGDVRIWDIRDGT